MFISRQEAVLTTALCLVTGLLPTGARADISTIIDDEKLIFTLHTHLYSSSKGLPSLLLMRLKPQQYVLFPTLQTVPTIKQTKKILTMS